MTKTQTAREITLDEIDNILLDVDMALWNPSLLVDEQLSCGFNDRTGMLEIGTAHSIEATFPLTVTGAEIKAWAAKRDEEGMVF